MYHEKTHHLFIELRAEGYSLNSIAEEMGISKPTALNWDRRFRAEIHDLKKVHMEDLQQLNLPKYDESLYTLRSVLELVDALLCAKYALYENLTFDQLIRARATLMAQVEKERARLDGWQQKADWSDQPVTYEDHVKTIIPLADVISSGR